MAKQILIVFETAWDRKQLAACEPAWRERYRVSYAEPADAETDWDLDIVDYAAREADRRRGAIDGVFSTSDYPGATVAGAMATALGLPGSPPESVLRASHKYRSRIVQREVAAEATPGFHLLDTRDPTTWTPPFGFPCFVKPVKGAFSVMSGKMSDAEELRAFLTCERVAWFEDVFLRMFDQLVRHFGVDRNGHGFVAEEVLRGAQVTVDGWRCRGGEGLLGIVDSTFAPGTTSFLRFDYPSALPREVQERMADVALRVTERLGLTDTLFNVEMTWDEASDRIGIVEVNPRACGQFADLYAKVDGVSGLEIALAIAAGDAPPTIRRGDGAFAAAASFPLRVFGPSVVASAPDADRVRRVEAAHPGTLVWLECATGDEMSDFGRLEDGASHRYAVVNLGGDSRDDLSTRCERIEFELGLEIRTREP